MIFELALLDPVVVYDELQKSLFLALHHHFSVVSVPISLVQKASSYLVATTRVSAIVDLPAGGSPLSLRIHAILEAARRGSKLIDLIINHGMLVNGDWKGFAEDIKSLHHVAKENGIEIRPVLEFRLLDASLSLEAVCFLKKNGFGSLVLGTGLIFSEADDNALMAKEIGSIGMDVVLTAAGLSEPQLNRLRRMAVHSVRFTSARLVKSLLGGY